MAALAQGQIRPKIACRTSRDAYGPNDCGVLAEIFGVDKRGSLGPDDLEQR